MLHNYYTHKGYWSVFMKIVNILHIEHIWGLQCHFRGISILDENDNFCDAIPTCNPQNLLKSLNQEEIFGGGYNEFIIKALDYFFGYMSNFEGYAGWAYMKFWEKSWCIKFIFEGVIYK